MRRQAQKQTQRFIYINYIDRWMYMYIHHEDLFPLLRFVVVGFFCGDSQNLQFWMMEIHSSWHFLYPSFSPFLCNLTKTKVENSTTTTFIRWKSCNSWMWKVLRYTNNRFRNAMQNQSRQTRNRLNTIKQIKWNASQIKKHEKEFRI